jgi:hypothetical protein
MIFASIPLIMSIIVVIALFTNIDEVIIEAVEIDISTFNGITNTWIIDSLCDVYLVKAIEYEQSNPSQWYLDNFSEERKALFDVVKISAWDSPARKQAVFDFYEALDKKTTPDLRGYQLRGYVPKETLKEDPQCYEILLEKYPNRIVG